MNSQQLIDHARFAIQHDRTYCNFKRDIGFVLVQYEDGTHLLDPVANPQRAVEDFQTWTNLGMVGTPIAAFNKRGVVLAQVKDDAAPTPLFHCAYVKLWRRDDEYWLSEPNVMGAVFSRHTLEYRGLVDPILARDGNAAPLSYGEAQSVIAQINAKHNRRFLLDPSYSRS